MPFAELEKVRIHYVLEGPSDAPVLVFSNSLGTDLHMWDSVVAAFGGAHRILRYDTRGHGRSGMPEGEYTFAMLGTDVLTLLDSLGIESAAFCGLSMGGMTGIWLGIHGGPRISHVILANTAARIGSPEPWKDRIRMVERRGLAPLADDSLDRWFTPAFREREGERMTAMLETFSGTPTQGYCSCCAALRDMDFYPDLPAIRKPCLVFAGSDDPVTPPADGLRLVTAIAGAEYCELPGRHLAPLENIEQFARIVIKFLGEAPSAGDRKAPRP